MNELPRTLKIATVWLGLITVVFLATQAWQRERQRTRFVVHGEQIEIRRGEDGHYHWPGRINGHAVEFLVDTGATTTAVPADLAAELGLQELGRVQSQTAGGVVQGRLVQGELSLQGGVQVDRLRMVALGGLDGHPLLGMDVLGRLRWRQADRVLTIDLREAP